LRNKKRIALELVAYGGRKNVFASDVQKKVSQVLKNASQAINIGTITGAVVFHAILVISNAKQVKSGVHWNATVLKPLYQTQQKFLM
jgi:hypothetical protein